MKVTPSKVFAQRKPSLTIEQGAPENPIALVQLAGIDTILLVHISSMDGHGKSLHVPLRHYSYLTSTVPRSLKRLLENGKIKKVGVGITSK